MGDPEYCLRRLADYQSAGINHFIFRVFFPGINPDHALRTVTMLAHHVVPAIKR